ncbi:MAG: hypothetical protein HC888_12405 [Candidatus Competibacteraceae bacterium]|nr:hypothetical protein [Candidatus Competibacteraceae bacterium]
MTLRRFYAERWWERKADAYSRIIETLYIIVDYFDVMSDDELSEQKISPEREDELNCQFRQARIELRKATRIGAYIISKDIAIALQELERRPEMDPRENGWYIMLEDNYIAHREALAKIRKLAKKDLRVR